MPANNLQFRESTLQRIYDAALARELAKKRPTGIGGVVENVASGISPWLESHQKQQQEMATEAAKRASVKTLADRAASMALGKASGIDYKQDVTPGGPFGLYKTPYMKEVQGAQTNIPPTNKPPTAGEGEWKIIPYGSDAAGYKLVKYNVRTGDVQPIEGIEAVKPRPTYKGTPETFTAHRLLQSNPNIPGLEAALKKYPDLITDVVEGVNVESPSADLGETSAWDPAIKVSVPKINLQKFQAALAKRERAENAAGAPIDPYARMRDDTYRGITSLVNSWKGVRLTKDADGQTRAIIDRTLLDPQEGIAIDPIVKTALDLSTETTPAGMAEKRLNASDIHAYAKKGRVDSETVESAAKRALKQFSREQLRNERVRDFLLDWAYNIGSYQSEKYKDPAGKLEPGNYAKEQMQIGLKRRDDTKAAGVPKPTPEKPYIMESVSQPGIYVAMPLKDYNAAKAEGYKRWKLYKR